MNRFKVSCLGYERFTIALNEYTLFGTKFLNADT